MSVINIKKLSKENEEFRDVIISHDDYEIVTMRLEPGEEIGEEIHDVMQFTTIKEGIAKVYLDDEEHFCGKGELVIIDIGITHNIINVGNDDLVLYTIYCPRED